MTECDVTEFHRDAQMTSSSSSPPSKLFRLHEALFNRRRAIQTDHLYNLYHSYYNHSTAAACPTAAPTPSPFPFISNPPPAMNTKLTSSVHHKSTCEESLPPSRSPCRRRPDTDPTAVDVDNISRGDPSQVPSPGASPTPQSSFSSSTPSIILPDVALATSTFGSMHHLLPFIHPSVAALTQWYLSARTHPLTVLSGQHHLHQQHPQSTPSAIQSDFTSTSLRQQFDELIHRQLFGNDPSIGDSSRVGQLDHDLPVTPGTEYQQHSIESTSNGYLVDRDLGPWLRYAALAAAAAASSTTPLLPPTSRQPSTSPPERATAASSSSSTAVRFRPYLLQNNDSNRSFIRGERQTLRLNASAPSRCLSSSWNDTETSGCYDNDSDDDGPRTNDVIVSTDVESAGVSEKSPKCYRSVVVDGRQSNELVNMERMVDGLKHVQNAAIEELSKVADSY